MEQLVILLLIALIAIIQWIVEQSKKVREKRRLAKRADQTGEDVKRGAPEPPPVTEGDVSMRRLREALGLPEEAEPPVIPERVERPVKPKKAKRAVTPPPPLPEPFAPPPPPKPERKPIVAHIPPRLEHRAFALPHRLAKPIVELEVPGRTSRFRELLASKGGLRDAVVLMEVLGPPKSVREGRLPS